jgi:hypothetical protein
VRSPNPLSTSHPEPNLSALVASILGVTVVKHEIIPLSLWRHRATGFFPRYLDSKEERKRMFRDYRQTNKREVGRMGQIRNVHLVYFDFAQEDRRKGKLSMARWNLSASREERLRDRVSKLSPMALNEGQR